MACTVQATAHMFPIDTKKILFSIICITAFKLNLSGVSGEFLTTAKKTLKYSKV